MKKLLLGIILASAFMLSGAVIDAQANPCAAKNP